MKTKHWMFLGALCLGALALEIEPPVFAQSPTPAQTSPPVIPAGDVPAPATDSSKTDSKKKEKAAAKTKKATPKPTAPIEKPRTKLSPGPAVATQKNVNLRGQAAINSEIVTRIANGEIVTVLEEVTQKAKADEPDRWAKVLLPANSVVWVSTHFIDPNKTVVPKRLNVRSGPGENFSILGRIEKGYVVKEVETKGEWMKIEAPTNAYAFIASHLLSTDPAVLGPALAKAHPPAPPTPPPPTEVAVVTQPPPTPPAEPLTKPPTPPTDPTTVVVAPPLPPPTTNAPVAEVIPDEPATEEPPPKRIVTREGVVKGSASIQAPTYFVLRGLENNRTVNYLFSPSNNIVMREFQLQRVIVTGEEVLDERWPNTPVIIVDSIEAVP